MPAPGDITLTGCQQHNLRNLDLSFPPDALIYVTGPSGAGKSSFVFGTLHAESRRRYLESLSTSERSRLEEISTPQLNSAENLPLTIALQPSSISTGFRSTLGTEGGLISPLQMLFAARSEGLCPECGQPVRTWQPTDILKKLEDFPPNTRLQLGFPFPQQTSSEEAFDWLTAAGFRRVVLDDRVLTLEELKEKQVASARLTVLVDRVKRGSTETSRLRESLETCYRGGRGQCEVFAEGPPVDSGWAACELDGQSWSRHRFTRHRDCLQCGRSMLDPVPALFRWTSPLGVCPECRGRGAVRESGKQDRQTIACPACRGARLNPDARGYQLHGCSLPDLHRLTIQQFAVWIESNLDRDFLQSELWQRVEYLTELGLAQLPLDLPTMRLSDAERISVSLVNSAVEPLPGALYLLEEPFSGRSRDEWPAVRDLLNHLRQSGAGVCLVQARSDIIHRWKSFEPDRIFHFGPGSGAEGGQLVEEVPIELPETTQPTHSKTSQTCVIRNISWPWIKETEVSFLTGGLSVVTGTAAARPVAFLREILTPVLSGQPSAATSGVSLDGESAFDQIQSLNVETRTPHPRQIVAAAIKAFGAIRTALAETDDAKKRNLTGKDLSLFNKEGARCVRCEGAGQIGVDLDFLPEFELRCPECGGSRYEDRVNDVRFRGLTLSEILELTAEEAFRVFKGHHSIQRKLQLLKQVRLGYLRLGQSLTEMSRGERRRLRLAAALAKLRGTRTLLLAEEISWGLATAELPSLLSVLREFTTAGHSVLLVDAHEFWENNSDNFVKLSPAE